jgi:hypothetical protein
MYTNATVSKNIQCIVSLLQLLRQNVMPRFSDSPLSLGLQKQKGTGILEGILEDLSLKPISGAW